MKKFVLILTSASFLVACNQTPKASTADTTVNPLDTAGLAAYHAAKSGTIITNELEQKEEASAPVAKAAPAKVRTVTRYVDVPVKHTTPRPAPAPVVTPNPVPTPAPTASTGSSTSAGPDLGSVAGVGNAPAAPAPAPEAKKGISKSAKGAIIGGVAGAAAGAIINKKNRGAGAVIGGIIGAAGGFGVGRSQDKKDGRVQLQ